MRTVLKLNSISPKADHVFAEGYEYSDKVENPDGIMLRSFAMHEYPIGSNLLAVARAGAGVNNIPIPAMTEKGIVVFNTPGANANAVKELAVCALLLGSRKIVAGINWVQSLQGQTDVAKLVEKGKGQFVGGEIEGKTLGVLGLGAIGAKVANAASALGMTVLGNDPFISVDNAWMLSRKIKHSKDRDELISKSDYITIHIPLTPDTKNMINKDTIAKMKDGVVIINCSRGELVNNDDIIAAIKSGKVSRYVTDFPNEQLLGIDNIITIPHLGASTPEAEDNCAVMAAEQLADYLENGNIKNSVNFPAVSAPRTAPYRITIAHKNVPNAIATATKHIGDNNINIANMVSASRGDLGYMIIDTDTELTPSIVNDLKSIPEFIRIRILK